MAHGRFRVLTVAALVAGISATLPAQQCRPANHPYFDFQVDRPAESLTDSSVSPRPVHARDDNANPGRVVVQFVVDTAGRADSASFKVLINSSPELAEAGRRALSSWRYSPALVDGCKVPQLVQVALRP